MDCMGALIWLREGGNIVADVERPLFIKRVVSPLLTKIVNRLEND